MGLLGKFLDRLCDERPDLAQAICDREIAPLNVLITDTGKCGCVVGTVALAGGFTPNWQTDFDAAGIHLTTWLGELLGWDPDIIDQVSLRVLDISCRISGARWTHNGNRTNTRRSDAIVVHLVRQRIATRLAMVGVA